VTVIPQAAAQIRQYESTSCGMGRTLTRAVWGHRSTST
jgi:hypothetical protein